MVVFTLMICCHVLALQVSCHNYLPLLQKLKMRNPYIIGKNKDLKTRNLFYLMKATMNENQTICLSTSINNKNLQKSPGVIIQSDEGDNFTFSDRNFETNINRPWIIVGDVENKHFQFDKPLYVLTNDTLWEFFKLRTLHKSNQLGSLHDNDFKWNRRFSDNFYERRGNFENLTLITMVDEEMSYNILPKNWKSLVNSSSVVPHSFEVCYKINKSNYQILSYLFSISIQITNLVSGEYQDILVLFSKMLNFRVRQFKRIDGIWGIFDKNTGQWNGMISNLIDGDADLIAASIDQCCMRTMAVDFLWAFTKDRKGFAIKSMCMFVLIPNCIFQFLCFFM